MLCSELGAGLCFTEMVSCNGLKYKDKATQKLLFTTPDEKIKAAQLLGSDPRIMEKMARSEYFEQFDIIDINMGCPVPNVFKSGEGSALLGDLKKASLCYYYTIITFSDFQRRMRNKLELQMLRLKYKLLLWITEKLDLIMFSKYENWMFFLVIPE